MNGSLVPRVLTKVEPIAQARVDGSQPHLHWVLKLIDPTVANNRSSYLLKLKIWEVKEE